MATGIQRISLAVRGLVGKVERVIALAQVIGQAEARVLIIAPAQVLVLVLVLVLAIVPAEALALAIAPAEARVLAIVPAEALAVAIVLAEVRVLIIVPAQALALAIVLAEAREPETVQVEAVPVRSHLRARLAVPLRIKSVTGPRRHDQVLVLTVEDLAGEVVETTHAQAAIEAAKVWAAAVTAVAAAPE
jgi:hypothetical protein